MDMTAALVAPASMLTATPEITAAEMAKRGDIKETAQKFEAAFMSIMIQQMFAGLETSGPFGGGDGEKTFRSFMTEAMANQMTKSGGIGLADTVMGEMLKLQGLES